MNNHYYTTQLQAGLGMIHETRILLGLWESGMTSPELLQKALDSGSFPTMSARRLRNLITECFAPRYLLSHDYPVWILKPLSLSLSSEAFQQLLFVFTARAHAVVRDFVKHVYWNRYAGGQVMLSNEEAREFIIQANQEGKTAKFWSETTIRRVAGYLTGCCADFGLLESGRRSIRKFTSFRIQPDVLVVLAYDLHFAGLGDNAMIAHPDWELFGLQKDDVREELRRLALKGFWMMQTAGDVIRMSWNFTTWEGVLQCHR